MALACCTNPHNWAQANYTVPACCRVTNGALLQIMSTEDVQDQHCAAFDAAMDCVQALLHDELQGEPTGTVRIILQHGQVGAVMGKRGATIK